LKKYNFSVGGESHAKHSQGRYNLFGRSPSRAEGGAGAAAKAMSHRFEESMTYGGPAYSRNGVVEVGFASQKHFIGLYILRTDVMKAHLGLLKIKGVSVGKGAIRYSKPEKIDFKVVESMLKATVESTGEVC
jgi:uncharacterized protein YdhG (YjbR/CyaY superfamily)